MNATTASNAESTVPEPKPAEDWRVLLVDDEPTQRLITARLLKRAGFVVETAQNGKEALEKIKTSEFQLLVTDWEMPEMDGVALCRAVRSAKLDGYVYTILVTSRDAIEHLVAGLQAGADDYLTKPVLEPELLARLNTGKRIVTLERSLRAANEENRRLSVTDALTGAFNRRYLMEKLPHEIERSLRYPHPLSLVMCDVDHFKKD
jgi:two-component system, cell cycle response regulator